MTHCQVHTQVILINIIIQNKPIFTIKRGTHLKKKKRLQKNVVCKVSR